MSIHPVLTASNRAGSEEFDLEEDELFEMANLDPNETGLEGWVRISTGEGQHGFRVKFYAGRPGPGQPSMSMTIEATPRVVASDLAPHIARRHEGQVRAWVVLNREKLQTFWTQGTSWSVRELVAFIDALEPLPG